MAKIKNEVSLDGFIHDWFTQDPMNPVAPFRYALVLRGLPGAGKSTFIKRLKEAHPQINVQVASADAHRIDAMGVYDHNAFPNAHQEALRDFIWSCHNTQAGAGRFSPQVVVADNTNIETHHAAPFIAIGAAYGLKPLVVNFDCDFYTSVERNRHNVPTAKIRKWHSRLQQIVLPQEWDDVTVKPD
jgi:predicted kinase